MLSIKKKVSNYDHLIFLDFEGTQFSHEMIAIGAVKADLKKDGTIKKFHKGFKKFVVAKENIGKVVTELTGITKQTLEENGIQFGVMQEQLKKYIKTPYEKCGFVTFGTHDIRILHQSVAHNLGSNSKDVKIMVKNHIDMAEILGEFIRDENGNIYSLVNYLKVFGIEFEGQAHDPLYDALNLGYLYKAIFEKPEIVEEHYLKCLGKKTHFPYPVQKAIDELTKGNTVTPEMYQQFIKDYVEK